MSGHSKWHNIAQKKGLADAKRGKTFSKIAKAITVSAKVGGTDQSSNFALRLAIEKAKEANMPKDNIERAIARGSGSGADGALETVVYEGMAPGGAAIIVEALTDNKNRVLTNIKNIFNKNGGNMDIKVMWQFERKGVVRVDDVGSISNKDETELELIEAGAEDISWEDGLEAISDFKNLHALEQAVSAVGLQVSSAEPEYIAKEKIQLSEDDENKLGKFIELLDEDDDVDNIYTNAT
ncbi:YebC/PmpR family DNA-binding transcriptional regulator [Candidatus Uhrbacteria bacterium CG_4_9_14_0_2_um_filter_41_50]|uniref:Probable transcriptional regulatory protein CO057_03605 n=1 Tax=Candidatus Uhrbacteria bacterium CG_4_9_14_0_2_um_filter_41_50 TaxID=1975031 RepID=A0A2M8ENF7_9BACT|nr:MAG: YebC/PmpR family DNA-binding transcriptional regulator [Candidatus Uhrbacteria bacterium CG_4_10_14_3_um_filter_41_21]PIZ54548.1 MAG: YebC/PmpR family DNA-binding transcriptional regulator [Candidatus Uhrbacteria bacterium CG_4_10_14_0_2_um_filter_41_21]PJB84815.1 MAG: YebC/PmpR family DNA-binding transcriptional regulator [Candidatus Uhrbacteria bacterium CG_4_9_14_0_8_um_filter_41_16]PJC24279.1 MAG: YebC/PmpR family DNA-binding transcriptional regulator [Candidatus Uhrbacteria bacteriu